VYYYCKIEQTYYGPDAVHRDADGRWRDPLEHRVEERKPGGR
jgi:hypothetical protein